MLFDQIARIQTVLDEQTKILGEFCQRFFRDIEVERYAMDGLVQSDMKRRQIALQILGKHLREAKIIDKGMAGRNAGMAFLEGFLAGQRPQKRGRRSQTKYRDLAILFAVATIARDGRLPPTRSRASSHPSACSIVQAALAEVGLHLSERTIEDIWNDRQRP